MEVRVSLVFPGLLASPGFKCLKISRFTQDICSVVVSVSHIVDTVTSEQLKVSGYVSFPGRRRV